jgi:hypothetical protein
MEFLSSAPERLEELALVYYDEAKRQINSTCKPLVFQRFWRRGFLDFSIAPESITD